MGSEDNLSSEEVSMSDEYVNLKLVGKTALIVFTFNDFYFFEGLFGNYLNTINTTLNFIFIFWND